MNLRHRTSVLSIGVLVVAALAFPAAGAVAAEEPPTSEDTITFTVLGEVDAEIGDEVSLADLQDAGVTVDELDAAGVAVEPDGTLSADPAAPAPQPEGSAATPAAPAAFTARLASAPTNRVAPRTGTYDVIATWRAKDGKTVTLRRAAYEKIVNKHNLTTAVVKRVTTSYSSRLGAGSATAFNYFLEAKQFTCNMLTCWVSASVWVQSTVDYRAITGGTFGVVTTYCQGVTLCPNWVKNALNV